ncbi:twin-arginine translocation pathway signal [Halomonas sp. GXIMD04776]|uniref:twin-arginine translocation pathway signal n=1 Tax=Halomonas sp. GXIMD04776 TaxID=3415605 RepID=UPI003CB501EA
MSHTPDKPASQPTLGRRRFLRVLGLGTAAAGAAAGLGNATFVHARSKDDDPGDAIDQPRLYRETDHVRAFYATLRD